MWVKIDGKKVQLDDKNVLGVGGEAVVLRHGPDLAVKLYHQPTPERAAKLRALLSLTQPLPKEVIGPCQLVEDVSASTVLGFTMPALPSRLHSVVNLSNRAFRTAQGVSAPQVARLFLNIGKVMGTVHRAGLVIGDFNDLNVLFENDEPTLIDVDSYQVGPHGCPVATETFLDPALYGQNLNAGLVFEPSHDWYSYAVMLFRSLLLVHPYGGNHRQWSRLTDRAVQRVTIFDPAVTYPKLALNPALLDDQLSQVFWHIFAEGERGVFPAQALTNYAADLTECDVCHNFYPARRRVCPVCEGLRLTISLPLPTSELKITRRLATDGPILVARAFGKRLLALAVENGSLMLYQLEGSQPTSRSELASWQPGARYDFMDGYLVVSPARTGNLLVLRLDTAGLRPLTRLTTNHYEGQPMFATTDHYLYRLAGNALLRGEIQYGQLVERTLLNGLEGQTWFEVEVDSTGDEVIIGFERIFKAYHWFRYDRHGRQELKPTLLEPTEALTTVVTHPGLIMRQTRQAGRAYLRLDEFDSAGHLQTSLRRPLDPEIGLTGSLYSNGVALWPSGNGLLKEAVGPGRQATMPDTAQVINPASRLRGYRQGLYIINEREILDCRF